MRWIRAAMARVIGLFRGDRAHGELREELEAHLAMATDELIRRGVPPAEARRQALIASGGLTQAAETVRDRRGLPWLEQLGADVRYAARSLRRGPAFALVVVVTLALAIGANTAIFSVVRGVLLKPLPHRDGDRLVYLRHSASGPGQESLTFSVPEVRDFRAGVPALGGIAEYSSTEVMHETSAGPVRIRIALVTGNWFDVMGLAAVTGRTTGPGDDGPAAAPVAVLGHDYWISRFGGDTAIVGRRIILDRRPVMVVGVLEPAPFFPTGVDALVTMGFSEHHMSAWMQNDRTHRMTEVVARLAPGATLAEVRTQVATTYQRLGREYREAYPAGAQYRVAVIPFREVMGERARVTLTLLMALAAFVLVVATANVANLTLMRGIRRRQELMMRSALGAGVARLRRLLLVENLMLTLLGAGSGIAVAMGGVRLLTALAARYSTRTADIRLDGVVLGFTLLVAVAIAVGLSLLASLPREGSLGSGLLGAAQRVSAGLAGQRIQRALVVVQVAVTVMLLAGAGLLTRTIIRLSSVETGLATEEILTMRVTLLTWAESRDPKAAAMAGERFARIRDGIAALPGVAQVGIGGTLPLRNSDFFNLVEAEGQPTPAGDAVPRAEFRRADPGFFGAAGIPLLAGRVFATEDDGRDVAIINATMAERFFRDRDPIGQRVQWKLDWRPDTFRPLTVVGVVADTRDGGPDQAHRLVVYQPLGALLLPSAAIAIRAERAEGLPVAATRIARQVAPDGLIEQVMTIGQYKAQRVSPRRLNAVLISAFGLLAVLIAAVGIAGVLAFSVSARTSEIGIRMSLGADRGRVQRMILREGGVLVGLGLVVGLVGAWLSAGVIRGLLFGVAPHDPITFAGVGAMIVVIGAVACWSPASRAARIDPAIAMRS